MSVVTDRYENIWRAEERAAATAKLKRLCKEIVPLEAVGSEDYQDGYVDGFADALGAVVRAWEEEP
jgi:hypothetical protein